jgi:hypothetical protein
VIIVASPDRRHWGESGFGKFRSGGNGTFLHYPVWTFEELLAAKEFIFPHLDVNAIGKRFRLFGGVPRNFLAMPADLLKEQKTGVTVDPSEFRDINGFGAHSSNRATMVVFESAAHADTPL